MPRSSGELMLVGMQTFSMLQKKLPLPEFTWDERIQRYRDVSSGRFVARAEVNAALGRVTDAIADNVRVLAEQLVNGVIGPAEFGIAMAEELKVAHLCAAAVANGGWDRMDQSAWGRVGNVLKNEYSHLRNWVAQIQLGEAPLDGRALVRASMYALQPFATYQSEVRLNHIESGEFTEERRVLDSDNPCVDCISYAADGWQPIGTLPSIGDSQCDGNCRCYFEFR